MICKFSPRTSYVYASMHIHDNEGKIFIRLHQHIHYMPHIKMSSIDVNKTLSNTMITKNERRERGKERARKIKTTKHQI